MSNRYRVVITNRVFPSVLENFDHTFVVDANPSAEPWAPDEWHRKVSEADAVIAFMPDCFDQAVLDECPDLRLISCALKGFGNFDLAACARRGITVTVVEDLLTIPTAELAIGLIISLSRNLFAGDQAVRTGSFRGWRPVLYGAGLHGATVGLMGMGAIGRAIASRLKPFGCSLLYSDRRRLDEVSEAQLGAFFVDDRDLLEESDFVILALPLTGDTRHWMGRKTLALMKPGAYLINPARGSLVDESAVADALASGHLAGYAADVFEFEDWARPDRPSAVSPKLLAMSDRTVFTPHLGSAVRKARLAIEQQAAQNVVDFFTGKQPRGVLTGPSCRGSGS